MRVLVGFDELVLVGFDHQMPVFPIHSLESFLTRRSMVLFAVHENLFAALLVLETNTH